MGIGSTTPRGALDINSPTTSVFGLVLPTNDSPDNMVNPQGGTIAFGTMMYDSTDDCIKYYQTNAANGGGQKWTPCILQATDDNTVKINYIPIGRSFTSTYKEDTPMTTANTFRIAVKNEGYSPASLNFLPTDLVISGVEGITVASVSPTTTTLNAGGTVELTYTLSGTPADCGPLTGTWKKLDLEYTRTINVVPNLIYNCAEGSWNNSVSPEYRLNGLVPGEFYTGTYTVPYTNDGEPSCDIPAETITRDGLTLIYPGGPVSPTGTITYTLSGTYTGTANVAAVTFTTSSGCQVYLGPCSSCKQLLELVPGTPDGVYKLDPDQGLTAFATTNAQCDMTTDGGGWTMVLNYLHSSGTNPTITVRTSLPIIASSTLAANESSNANTWGHASRALQAALKPTEYRFYGITSAHNRVMHFKTAHAGSITFFTTGVGNANGIQNSFTPLSGHTTNLPAAANEFFNGGVNNELTFFPFYNSLVSWCLNNNRWEMDDNVNVNNNRHTLHRVWVR
ncbi:hypothetical protein GCM10010984_25260 [Chishuiella changwenlii]|uniref:Fibrinogen C-terminal domain-containing protein n=1 Tax=Chishuiella changwenlii TaxID=1434701 RepID=A0ABQ1TZU1_9FLAO|nr:hypothetical protein GCM10010984_25260 [Chishuiella changwenlii]